ncbi:MAG: hypothetical protein ABI726_02450 [bacterium]
MADRRDQAGQSTVEWLGLVLLVALLALGLATIAGARLPGYALARALADRLICAAGLGRESCGVFGSELATAYGAELAHTVRRRAPTIAYEDGMRALPVDFRSCRQDPCSMGVADGEVLDSLQGEPVTLFVHVIDCRADPPPELERADADCSGERAGKLYLQFWAYYPGSQSLKALPGDAGFHNDDWESLQLRIGDGGAEARASSHHGYNYEGGAGNWLSDAGLAERQAWGPAGGRYYISGGSHAGHASQSNKALGRWTPSDGIRLVPVEEVARGRWGDTSFAVTAPWLKRVYRDPEYLGTD